MCVGVGQYVGVGQCVDTGRCGCGGVVEVSKMVNIYSNFATSTLKQVSIATGNAIKKRWFSYHRLYWLPWYHRYLCTVGMYQYNRTVNVNESNYYIHVCEWE